jgi:hypothetical protein
MDSAVDPLLDEHLLWSEDLDASMDLALVMSAGTKQRATRVTADAFPGPWQAKIPRICWQVQPSQKYMVKSDAPSIKFRMALSLWKLPKL